MSFYGKAIMILKDMCIILQAFPSRAKPGNLYNNCKRSEEVILGL